MIVTDGPEFGALRRRRSAYAGYGAYGAPLVSIPSYGAPLVSIPSYGYGSPLVSIPSYGDTGTSDVTSDTSSTSIVSSLLGAAGSVVPSVIGAVTGKNPSSVNPNPANPALTSASFLSNPMVLAGGAALALAVGVALMKRKKA